MPVLFSKSRANTSDTVKLILETIENFSNTETVVRISNKLNCQRNEAFLRRLFNFVCNNVVYERDPIGKERVTTPKRLLLDGVGDCKKMTTFIGAILLHCKIPFLIKVVGYSQDKWDHIFIIVPRKDGSYITVDPVNNCKFNKEVKFIRAKTINRKGKTMELSLLGRMNQSANPDIPDKLNIMGSLENFDNDLFSLGQDNRELGSEIEIYSLESMAGRKERRARRAARKARAAARKAEKRRIRALPRAERKAVRRVKRQDRKARRKDARAAKKLGKSIGLPGPISKFIGKWPEMWLMFFAKNDNPEYELSPSGIKKFNRVSRAASKVQRRKGVSPAQLLSFVDTVIEKKYGMSAEEFVPVWIQGKAVRVGQVSGIGLGEPLTAATAGIITGAIAAAAAIAAKIVGLSKDDINESDLPDEADITLGDEGTTTKRSKVRAWLSENAGGLLKLAGDAFTTFKRQVGDNPTGADIDRFLANDVIADDGKVDKTTQNLLIAGGVGLAALLFIPILTKPKTRRKRA